MGNADGQLCAANTLSLGRVQVTPKTLERPTHE